MKERTVREEILDGLNSIPNLTGGVKYFWYLCAIILLPWILQAGIILIALFPLVPICFVMHAIKHRETTLWVLISIFVNLGGLVDITMDCIMSVKPIMLLVSDDSSTDGNLAQARALITLCGGAGGLLVALLFFILDDVAKKQPVSQNSAKVAIEGFFLFIVSDS